MTPAEFEKLGHVFTDAVKNHDPVRPFMRACPVLADVPIIEDFRGLGLTKASDGTMVKRAKAYAVCIWNPQHIAPDEEYIKRAVAGTIDDCMRRLGEGLMPYFLGTSRAIVGAGGFEFVPWTKGAAFHSLGKVPHLVNDDGCVLRFTEQLGEAPKLEARFRLFGNMVA